MAGPISATCPKFLYDNSHSLYPYPTKRVRKQPRQDWCQPHTGTVHDADSCFAIADANVYVTAKDD